MREIITSEQAFALYVIVMGAAHVIATLMAGPLCGFACILTWLILWWFYRRELRNEWGVAGPHWTGEVVRMERRP